MTKTIEQLNERTRVSIVKWNDHDYSVQTQYNMFPFLDPKWTKYEVLDERELSSSMQVYGYLQEQRENL